MATPWTQTSEPATPRASGDLVTLIEGSTFCISEDDGRVRTGRAQGLFVRDTRFLSAWQVRLDGKPIQPLTVQRSEPFAAMFIGRVPPEEGHADSQLLVLEHRHVGDGMRSDLTVRNLGSSAVRCTVSVEVDCDFADLFEVKDGRITQDVDVVAHGSRDGLEITGARHGRKSSTRIVAGGDPSSSDRTLTWEVSVSARQAWSTCLEVHVAEDGQPMDMRHPCGSAPEHTAPARRMREWRRLGPEVSTADPNLAAVLAQSVEDLGALRIFDPRHPERAVVAAGMPWFMALFGRDALLTSWMVLPLDSSLALGTLQTLASYQGHSVDPVTEEQPGRVLHEMRFGPAATVALGGRGVYYGTADATSLFVMLLGELSRWGVAAEHIDALLPHADRALAWIEQYGDRDGDGFVEYHRSTDSGLANQGWKDSWDGITFIDGRLAQSPIALCEVQGYTYAAYTARAHLARERGESAAADHWMQKASHLRRAFNDAFWLPGQRRYALGLDAEKQPIDAMASNIGHCLWTGIIDPARAPSVAAQLMSEDMFSGWGIRTLAASMGAYNPMSYHNGSIWPHDNAICAAGLMRYGFIESAQRVAVALLDAATRFGNRLPELFCGFRREEFSAPVPYPTSCAPQAWAAATPLHLLRTLLRLEPQAATGRVWCAPDIPERYLPLVLRNLRIGPGHLSVEVHPEHTRVDDIGAEGLELMPGPRPVHGELTRDQD